MSANESEESVLMFDVDDLISDFNSSCSKSPTSFKEHDDFCEATHKVMLTL